MKAGLKNAGIVREVMDKIQCLKERSKPLIVRVITIFQFKKSEFYGVLLSNVLLRISKMFPGGIFPYAD